MSNRWLNRRQFLTTLFALASLMPLLAAPSGAASGLLKPPRLRRGDRVGLISPAGATFLQEQLDIVVDAVRGLGLVPQLAPHVGDRYGYLAGQDADRAGDVNAFFADPDIAALLPIQGGWGSARILPYLDYEVIRRHPKILVGFSDITALLLGIHAQTGLVTFHGPHGLTAWRPNQTEPFRRVLFNGEAVTIQNQPAPEDGDRLMQVRHRIQTITPGTAEGPLVGGNLSVLSGIVGSPYMPRLEGAILFLEDVGEAVYRVDRLLTHLALAGVFDGLAGIIIGQCTGCEPGAGYGALTLEEVLRDHLAPLGIPAWSGALIGHVEPILTLPIGTRVAIDASQGTIRMLEGAVV
ncbi:MAG: LD-carboxypeptidase [Synechococcales bacterium]|nr:LD-carboxypeptidase [Synechococcales bacterium]